MTTNPTQRHTARPSRSRVLRARVSAWYNRHADALAWCSLIAFTVAFALAFTYALTLDAPSAEWISAHPVLAFVGIAFAFVAFAFVVGAFVHLLTQDITARQLSRAHARTLARVSVERDLESQSAQNVEDCLRADIARLTRERDALRADIATERRMARDMRFALGTARDERAGLAYVLGEMLDGVSMRHAITDACDAVTGLTHRAPSENPETLASACDLVFRHAQDAYLARYDA